MKKLIAVLLALTLSLATSFAVAGRDDPKYTLEAKGIVLQNQSDRGISPAAELTIHPLIDGESPTTGLPVDSNARYMPMLVQISNASDKVKVDGKNVEAAGVGKRAPWGVQYADIVYEDLIYQTGVTRFTFLFSDSLAQGLPISVGAIRSTRQAHALLGAEWQGGLVFAGGPRIPGYDFIDMMYQLGENSRAVVFNLKMDKYTEVKNRIQAVKAPDNYDVNLAGMRELIPAEKLAAPHPFLFANVCPYGSDYAPADTISLDWGNEKYVSHFKYDNESGLYQRYAGNAPFKSYLSAGEREEDTMAALSYSNVIVQRTAYDWSFGNLLPIIQAVGHGNADIFTSGRYIPGYWVRADAHSPTVYLDDQGHEIRFARGKTFIADFPPEALLTFQGRE